MKTIGDFFALVLASGALVMLLLAAFGWLFRTWLFAKITGSIKFQLDKELASHNNILSEQLEVSKNKLKLEADGQIEKAKSDLAQRNAVQLAAHASYSQHQEALSDRRLLALDELWKSVVEMRLNCSASLGRLDYVPDEKYKSVLFTERLLDLSWEEYTKNCKDYDVRYLVHQPFIDPYLWDLVQSYNRFRRMVAGATLNLKDKKISEPWFNSSIAKFALKRLLSSKEFEEFQELKIARLDFVETNVEEKIVSAIRLAHSGKEAAKVSLADANELRELLTTLNQANSSFQSVS
jgi:hypothetical protein